MRKSDDLTPRLLRDLSLHIVSFNISDRRLDILKSVIRMNGGVYTPSPTAATTNTLILTDFPSISELKAALSSGRGEKVREYSEEECDRMLRLDWLSMSIERGRLLDQRPFKLAHANTSSVLSTAIDESDAESISCSRHSDADLSDDEGDGATDSLLAADYANDGWACKHRCRTDHPNSEICEQLAVIQRFRYLTGDFRGELSYARAIASLRGYPRKVASGEEARAIRGIGPKISSTVQNILDNNLAEIAAIESDPRYRALRDLCRIYGVGPKTAGRWHQMGIESVGDLVGRNVRLSQVQRCGLKYFTDWQQPMTRNEVEEIHDAIRTKLAESHRLVPTGGYRRGKLLSNDVDVLVYCESGSTSPDELARLVDRLAPAAILHITTAVSPHSPEESGFDRLPKCLCAIKLPTQKWTRRVDIVLVTDKSMLPWAQLGWTGSRQFERSLRLWAERECNGVLSCYGLFDKSSKSFVELPELSEEACFEALGLEYIAPEYRNS